MTNTKFRKRALLSSVAMLLVALVALGSATFAWFTSSTTATADGINVKTTQASDLQISDVSMNWGTQVHYSTTQQIFEPCSSANGVNWFSGEGTSRTDGAQKSGQNWKTIAAPDASKYYFTNMLNVRNNGTAAVDSVTINFSIPETGSNKYIRVALAEVTAANDTAATTANPTPAAFQAGVFDLDGVAYNAVTAVDAAATEITPEKTNFSINVGKLNGKTESATATKYYRLYVWFEGQDTDCQDQYAGNALSNIQFTVSGNTSQS